MTIKIKNMMSLRCVMAVETELKKLGIGYSEISLGEVKLTQDLDSPLRATLKDNLALCGLELIFDKKLVLIERIQNAIIELFKLCREQGSKPNYAAYISERLNERYTYLAALFSEVKGITLRQFIIELKIDKVKELLSAGLKPIEISHQMGYSSLAHLSHQFKKATGHTLSGYRNSGVTT